MYTTKQTAAWNQSFTSIEAKIGRPLAVVKRYHDWSNSGGNGQFPDASEKKLGADGKRILSFAWTSNVYRTGQKDTQWRAIASGRYDRSVIVPEAKRIKAWHHPVFLTFDHEMDGRFRTRNGSAADYVNAYRHIHNVFKRLNVTNVLWVWNPTGTLANAAKIKASYPGNSYVDWIAWDPYNFYKCHGTAWRTPLQTFSPFYRWLMSNGFGSKPFMLGEYGSTPDPTNAARQGHWYAGVPAALKLLPNIKAVVQFNSADPGRYCGFQITTNSRSLAGFRSASLAPYTQARSLG